MRNNRCILLLASLFISFTLRGQVKDIQVKDINRKIAEIDSVCNTCINWGANPENCTYTKNTELDAILNEVYSGIRLALDSAAFSKIKSEQRLWLKERNKNQEILNRRIREIDDEMERRGERALALESDSRMIEDRIKYLLKVSSK